MIALGLGWIVGVAIGSMLLSGWIIRSGPAALSMDVPNERSSHMAPTPRGGGIVMVGFILLTLAIAGVGRIGDPPLAYTLFAGTLAVAASGWTDDRGQVPVGVRLAIHTAAAMAVIVALGGIPAIHVGSAVVPLGWASGIAPLLGLVWLTNLYNFMDGIDGLAAGQAVVGGAFLAGVLWWAGHPGLALISAVAAASTLGFLRWNWGPARIFMGDVGSCTLGFLFGSLALAADKVAGLSLPVLLVPFAVFIVDATYTLLRRMVKGEVVWRPHRSHVYQRLVRAGRSHRNVAGLAVGLSVVLAALAFMALLRPGLAVPVLVLTVALVAASGWALLRLSPAAS